MDLSHFKNLHAGETALIVGNGLNLHHTPPHWFKYPAFGMNTIHKWIDWNPTYYVAVDHRVYREFGEEISRKYKYIPKFVLSNKLDEWQGDNFVRFPQSLKSDIRLDDLENGIAGTNVMHFAMQLAYYMGFTTLLIIGMQHKLDAAKAHFWGTDDGIRNPAPLLEWFRMYREIVKGMAARGVGVLNISEDTYVPDEVIPRGNWRDYEKSKVLTRLSGSRD